MYLFNDLETGKPVILDSKGNPLNVDSSDGGKLSINGFTFNNESQSAANWTRAIDGFTDAFAEQNQQQLWKPEEIPLSNDLACWQEEMSEEEKKALTHSLMGLTQLDTSQGDIGMPMISLSIDSKQHQRKALLNFMAMVENLIHVKSYSGIFQTLLPQYEIDNLYTWAEGNKHLQSKVGIIVDIYKQIDITGNDKIANIKGKIASVMLESFMFYSGFYYPLYLYGQGRMIASGETINLIIRDEAIHGAYNGMLAQEEIALLNSVSLAKELETWSHDLITTLYTVEEAYTKDLYDDIGLTEDALNFVQFNANAALSMLGYDSVFNHEPVNPIILNGLKTDSKSHDFFSTKGNSYIIAKIESMQESDYTDTETQAMNALSFLG